MSKKDAFGDEVIDKNQDFASMFEQSMTKADRKIRSGDRLRGEILSIGKEEAFVSTGTPTDGVLLTRELLDDQKVIKYKVGDVIDVVVLKSRDGEVRLGLAGQLTSNSDVDSLEDAFDMELPVEGKVIEVVKGGFRVEIQKTLAFCPVSQIDRKFVTDTQVYVGHKYDFLITQFEQKGRNVVVSRRKLMDLQQVEVEGAWMQSHKVGDTMAGKIIRLEKFGAFVELEGGVEGLVHISEISWNRIREPADVLKVNDSVQVKILKIEEAGDRLKVSLSIRQLIASTQNQVADEDTSWKQHQKTESLGAFAAAFSKANSKK